jgi:hypothetical protein
MVRTLLSLIPYSQSNPRNMKESSMYFMCRNCDEEEDVYIESEFGWRIASGDVYCSKCAIEVLGPD